MKAKKKSMNYWVNKDELENWFEVINPEFTPLTALRKSSDMKTKVHITIEEIKTKGN